MIATGSVEIEWNKVPEVQQTIVCRAFIDGALRLVDLMKTDPALKAEFEAWQKARYQ